MGSSRAEAATAAINDIPIASVDTALALRVLEPLWKKTPVTAAASGKDARRQSLGRRRGAFVKDRTASRGRTTSTICCHSLAR